MRYWGTVKNELNMASQKRKKKASLGRKSQQGFVMALWATIVLIELGLHVDLEP